MNKPNREQVEQAVDAVLRDGMAELSHRWKEFIGEPLTGWRDVVNYIVAEHGMPYSEAKQLTPAEAADLLAAEWSPWLRPSEIARKLGTTWKTLKRDIDSGVVQAQRRHEKSVRVRLDGIPYNWKD